MSEAYICLRNVSKRFKEQEVIKPVRLELEKGRIYGLVGRNGSGKTVLMKMILGLMKPTGGEIFVGGKQIGRDVDFPESVGAIIENMQFIPYYNAYDNLHHIAAIRHIASKQDLHKVLERVGLADVKRKKVGKFSLGMRQRLAIAQAIMEHPELIVLDEPMNGLDKSGVEEMRRLFIQLKEEGATILLASHNMEDVRQLCDMVFEIDAGNVISE